MPSKLLKSLRKKKDLAHFFYIQRTGGLRVPDQPHFDSESTAHFLNALENCKRYLEYGSGGSTVLAAALEKPMISVDSDPYFLKSVVEKIRQAGHFNSAHQQFLHADIGITRQWGKPLFNRLNDKRRERWASYSEAPWQEAQNADPLPDLVLVDGRFRVACALMSIKKLSGQQCAWQLLVDDYDYKGKFRYREIERFADLKKLAGRMAVFEEKADLDRQALDEAIAKYQQIPT